MNIKSKKFSIFSLVILGIFLLYYRFFPFGPVFSGKALFFTFWLLFLIFLKINSKFSVILGLALLLFCAFLLLLNHQGVALRVAVYSYGFLTIGAILQFFNLLKRNSS